MGKRRWSRRSSCNKSFVPTRMASFLSILTKRRQLGHQLGHQLDHYLVKTVPIRKFRLVCDNAPVHSCIERFDNLKVVFLPAHCTAVFQSLDICYNGAFNQNTKNDWPTFFWRYRTKKIAKWPKRKWSILFCKLTMKWDWMLKNVGKNWLGNVWVRWLGLWADWRWRNTLLVRATERTRTFSRGKFRRLDIYWANIKINALTVDEKVEDDDGPLLVGKETKKKQDGNQEEDERGEKAAGG